MRFGRMPAPGALFQVVCCAKPGPRLHLAASEPAAYPISEGGLSDMHGMQAWEPISSWAQEGKVTLVYGARDTAHNQAVVLMHYLQQHSQRKRQGRGRAAEH
jgi:hypothetical protein